MVKLEDKGIALAREMDRQKREERVFLKENSE